MLEHVLARYATSLPGSDRIISTLQLYVAERLQPAHTYATIDVSPKICIEIHSDCITQTPRCAKRLEPKENNVTGYYPRLQLHFACDPTPLRVLRPPLFILTPRAARVSRALLQPPPTC